MTQTCKPLPALDKAQKKPRRMARRARRGLLQIIIALAFAIAAIVIIFQLSAYGWRLWKETQLNMQLTRITATVDRVWERRGDFPAASMTETVVRRGEFTGSSVQGTTPNRTLVSPYDTTVTVTGLGGRDYTVTYADIPNTACESLLENYINDTTSIDGVSVEGTALTMPVTAAQIDTNCAGTADDQYTVVLTY